MAHLPNWSEPRADQGQRDAAVRQAAEHDWGILIFPGGELHVPPHPNLEERALRHAAPPLTRHRTSSCFWIFCGLPVLVIAALLVSRFQWVAGWKPFLSFVPSGRVEVFVLLALALTIGLLVRLTRLRSHADQPLQERTGELTRENAAVIRACRAVAHEFAQPLTGALAYSEMLIADAAYSSEAQRYELEGLREGVLRMERLLCCLREAVTDTAASATDRRVADEVEQAVGAAHARRRAEGAHAGPRERYEASSRRVEGWRNI